MPVVPSTASRPVALHVPFHGAVQVLGVGSARLSSCFSSTPAPLAPLWVHPLPPPSTAALYGYVFGVHPCCRLAAASCLTRTPTKRSPGRPTTPSGGTGSRFGSRPRKPGEKPRCNGRCVRASVRACVGVCMHACVRVSMRACVCACVRACVHRDPFPCSVHTLPCVHAHDSMCRACVWGGVLFLLSCGFRAAGHGGQVRAGKTQRAHVRGATVVSRVCLCVPMAVCVCSGLCVHVLLHVWLFRVRAAALAQGCTIRIGGMLPSYPLPYNKSRPYAERVDWVVEHVNLGADLVMMYFDAPDSQVPTATATATATPAAIPTPTATATPTAAAPRVACPHCVNCARCSSARLLWVCSCDGVSSAPLPTPRGGLRAVPLLFRSCVIVVVSGGVESEPTSPPPPPTLTHTHPCPFVTLPAQAHLFGPDSAEVNQSLVVLDATLSDLLQCVVWSERPIVCTCPAPAPPCLASPARL